MRDAAARIAEQLKEKKARANALHAQRSRRLMRPRAPQVHLLRRLCDRFGVSLANEVLQETLTVEVRRMQLRWC